MNDLFDAIYESPPVSQNNFFQQGTRFQPVFYVFELFHVLIKHATSSLVWSTFAWNPFDPALAQLVSIRSISKLSRLHYFQTKT